MRIVTIEILQAFAKSKNGVLLSAAYENQKVPMLWKCKHGHTWKASWHSVRSMKSWCPYCANCGKDCIETLQAFAKSKHGVLLSSTYLNSDAKLDWQCQNGHRWRASWSNVKNQNHWCPVCAKTKKPDLAVLKATAASLCGSLLSTEYINNKQLLRWQCHKGHTWDASWYSVNIRNSWCPSCASFKTESLCRDILESLFEVPFRKTRIYYSSEHKQRFFEFDGYNAALQLAFEYNGIQHYNFPNYYHKTEAEFYKQLETDSIKRDYCASNNISLLTIPYTQKDTLISFILEELHGIQNL